MKVAVTGASGFVGGAIAEALRLRGHEVYSYSRRPAAGRWQPWDIAQGLVPDAPRVDAVVHAAAAVGDRLSDAEAWQSTVRGTDHVRRSFPEAHLVHISSSSVYDPHGPSIDATEDAAPVAPCRYVNAYGRAKAAAEVLLRGGAVAWRDDRVIGDRLDAPVTILRPHGVYGPGDTTLIPRIEAAVRRGTLLLPAGGQVAHTLTHIANLVAAVLGALADPRPMTMNVGDAQPVVLAAMLSEYFARKGRPVRIRAVPRSLAWAAAGVIEAVPARRAAERLSARLNRYLVSHIGMERTYDLSRWKSAGGRPEPASLAWVTSPAH